MKKLILILILCFCSIPIMHADVSMDAPLGSNSSQGVEEGVNQESKVGNNGNLEEKTSEGDGENTETTAVTLKSPSAIIMEASTKKVLLEKASHDELAPASMTKIMTMLLIVEEIEKGNLSLDDDVIISQHAAGMGGSQVYLEANSHASVRDLLTSIGIASANDAAVAMAEKIGGTEENFVSMMNKRAKELGCTNTNFKNAHGLDEEGHYSSSYDMALMASELVKHEDILDITSTYETTLNHQNGKSIWLVNTNSLIRFYSGLDGLKTGFTDNAGYCLTGTMKRNDMRLITVVMHASLKEDRNTDTINMMEYAFSMFYKDTLVSKDKVIGEMFIDNSKDRKVKYYLEEDASVVLDKNVKSVNYKYDIELDNVKAPLKKGDVVGKLILKYDDTEKEYNLIVKDDVKEAGYFNRMLNYFKDIVSGNVNVINF